MSDSKSSFMQHLKCGIVYWSLGLISLAILEIPINTTIIPLANLTFYKVSLSLFFFLLLGILGGLIWGLIGKAIALGKGFCLPAFYEASYLASLMSGYLLLTGVFQFLVKDLLILGICFLVFMALWYFILSRLDSYPGSFLLYFVPAIISGIAVIGIRKGFWFDYLLGPGNWTYWAYLALWGGGLLLGLGLAYLWRLSPKIVLVLLLLSLAGGGYFLKDNIWYQPEIQNINFVKPPQITPNRPNIVILIIDTVRAQNLSCYGYSKPTSPNADQLAARGVLFENCIAQGAWSAPSHASIFTGLYPSQHQVDWTNFTLDSHRLLTIPQVLKAAGYQTASFCSNPWINKPSGFLQGFDAFYQTNIDNSLYQRFLSFLKRKFGRGREGDSPGIIYHMGHWFRNKHNPDKPCFIFINIMDAHFPYDPPEPYRSRFISDQAGKIGGELLNIVNHAPEILRTGIYRNNPPLVDLLESLYNGNVAHADANLGQAVSILDTYLPPENTMLIVTSDHGENVGDHGLLEHAGFLYDTTQRVPLIMRYPKGDYRGQRVRHLVQLIDLFPTVMEAAGIAQENFPWRQGVSLSHLNNEQEFHPFVISECRGKSIRTLDFKYIQGGLKGEELYNLVSDPGETQNLIQTADPEKLNGLKTAIKTWEENLPIPKVDKGSLQEFDSATINQLKALGYIQ